MAFLNNYKEEKEEHQHPRKEDTMTRAQSATAFDRYNGALCTITFENGLSVNQQDALQLLTLGFRPSCIDGGIAARFYLEFSSGNSVTMRDYYGYIRPHTSVIFFGFAQIKVKKHVVGYQ